jgi:endo-1,4-beta-xylanase
MRSSPARFGWLVSGWLTAGCGSSHDTKPTAQPDASTADGWVSSDAGVADAPAEGDGAPETLRAATGPHFGLDRVGAATSISLINSDLAYSETLAREFNYLTPENDFKWGPIQPDPATWNWAPADALVAWARSHGMSVKGHNLVWHNQLPAWVTGLTDKEQIRQALVDHVQTEVAHFKGQVVAWDVVNEAVRDDGRGLRTNVFSSALGLEYIELAFRTAHDADPDALLIYNDYGDEGSGVKSDAIFNLLEGLLAKGVPIGGVGLQMHIDAAEPTSPEDMQWNVQRLGALGLRVNISEMDVRVGDVAGPLAQKLSVQRGVYHDLVAVCVAEPACDAVTFWGFTDAHTWIDQFAGPNNYPQLFDVDYTKKPAYDGVLDAMLDR